jgi:hypothetical protein
LSTLDETRDRHCVSTGLGVDLISRTPDARRARSPACQNRNRPIQLSSASRWSTDARARCGGSSAVHQPLVRTDMARRCGPISSHDQRSRFNFLSGQPALHPSVHAAGEWVNAFYTHPLQVQRHTGAGGLAGSCADQDHVVLQRDLAATDLDFVDGNAQRTGNRAGQQIEIQALPQIDDGNGILSLQARV